MMVSNSPLVAEPHAKGLHRPQTADQESRKNGIANASHQGPSRARENENIGAPSQPTSIEKLEEAAILQELRARDQEVRAHEMAHLSVAGQHATGGPQFSYTTGPDGKQYAVGGEVPIDLSKVSGDPHATLAKATQIQKAALAPLRPSSTDRAVAAQASALATEARAEIAASAEEEVAKVYQQNDPQDPSFHTTPGHSCPECAASINITI